jgi:hypothetical protein
MHLTPLATALNAMLARLLLAIAEELDPSTVNEQVQGTFGAAIRDLDGERLLSAAQRRVIRNGPVQVAAWYDGGKDDPKLVLLRFDPASAEIWRDGSSQLSGLQLLFGGDPQADAKDNVAKVSLS